MKNAIKHTLVLHTSPDLEVLFMVWLIRRFEQVRDRLNVSDNPALKFIPAGPLRAADWPGASTLVPEDLENSGYRFVDCGGGKLDQHDRGPDNGRNSLSSLDLLVHYAKLDEVAPHLMPLVAIISGNDLSGKDIVRDTQLGRSVTPHTPRHLRNIILGWNLIHQDQPLVVADLACLAFDGIERLIGEALDASDEDHLAGSQDPGLARYREAISKLDCRSLFLADNVVRGANGVLMAAIAEDGDEQAAQADMFRQTVESALGKMEAEWRRGVEDYGRRTRIIQTTHCRKVEGVTVGRTIVLAVGQSDSSRFGPVTRLGNEGPRDKRPHRDLPGRPKADVTIQFRSDGRFVIATKGIELCRVARTIREADLRRKGVQLTAEEIRTLDRIGHLSFRSLTGETVQALYLAEYKTAFGNGFRGNPCAEPSALDSDEIVSLTMKALEEVE